MSDRIKVIYGAASLGNVFRISDEEKKATLDVLKKHGVDDLDTASSYVWSSDRYACWIWYSKPKHSSQ